MTVSSPIRTPRSIHVADGSTTVTPAAASSRILRSLRTDAATARSYRVPTSKSSSKPPGRAQAGPFGRRDQDDDVFERKGVIVPPGDFGKGGQQIADLENADGTGKFSGRAGVGDARRAEHRDGIPVPAMASEEGPKRRTSDEGQVGLDDEDVPTGIGPQEAPRGEDGPAGPSGALLADELRPGARKRPPLVGGPIAGHDHGPMRLDRPDGVEDEPEHRRAEDGVKGLWGPGPEAGVLPPARTRTTGSLVMRPA